MIRSKDIHTETQLRENKVICTFQHYMIKTNDKDTNCCCCFISINVQLYCKLCGVKTTKMQMWCNEKNLQNEKKTRKIHKSFADYFSTNNQLACDVLNWRTCLAYVVFVINKEKSPRPEGRWYFSIWDLHNNTSDEHISHSYHVQEINIFMRESRFIKEKKVP